ncbi:unnamed protein product, partial [Tetraodon nigroviridis]
SGAMRTTLACVLFSIRLYEACAELVFRQLPEGHTLQLSCSLGEQAGPHTELPPVPLRGAEPDHPAVRGGGGRAQGQPGAPGAPALRGGLSSPQVNVSVSALQRGDSGLYVCERSSRGGNTSEQAKLEVGKDHRRQPTAPIYEEMSSKQKRAEGVLPDPQEAPLHLEEATFPVYANRNILLLQDDHYLSQAAG